MRPEHITILQTIVDTDSCDNISCRDCPLNMQDLWCWCIATRRERTLAEYALEMLKDAAIEELLNE